MLECRVDIPLSGMRTPLYFFLKIDEARSALSLSIDTSSHQDAGDCWSRDARGLYLSLGRRLL